MKHTIKKLNFTNGVVVNSIETCVWCVLSVCLLYVEFEITWRLDSETIKM